MPKITQLRKTIGSYLGHILTPEMAAAIELATVEAPRSDALRDKISFALKGDEDAVALFTDLRDVLHFWDDLIDSDQPVTASDINRAMFTALVGLPANTFYQKHVASLLPTLTNAIGNWHTANAFEKTDDAHKLQIAFVIRSDYTNLLIQMAYLVGGHDWMTQVTPMIREMWTSENYRDYLNNLAAERQATRHPRIGVPDVL